MEAEEEVPNIIYFNIIIQKEFFLPKFSIPQSKSLAECRMCFHGLRCRCHAPLVSHQATSFEHWARSGESGVDLCNDTRTWVRKTFDSYTLTWWNMHGWCHTCWTSNLSGKALGKALGQSILRFSDTPHRAPKLLTPRPSAIPRPNMTHSRLGPVKRNFFVRRCNKERDWGAVGVREYGLVQMFEALISLSFF